MVHPSRVSVSGYNHGVSLIVVVHHRQCVNLRLRHDPGLRIRSKAVSEYESTTATNAEFMSVALSKFKAKAGSVFESTARTGSVFKSTCRTGSVFESTSRTDSVSAWKSESRKASLRFRIHCGHFSSNSVVQILSSVKNSVPNISALFFSEKIDPNRRRNAYSTLFVN